uniref:uncharacterized protein LOC127063040 n=1 Tax=Vespula vulgaris TaxID=7454 RepID=UPI0021425245|nr:uncharacterized protein LOC127063040 [Vespula vulgaris]
MGFTGNAESSLGLCSIASANFDRINLEKQSSFRRLKLDGSRGKKRRRNTKKREEQRREQSKKKKKKKKREKKEKRRKIEDSEGRREEEGQVHGALLLVVSISTTKPCRRKVDFLFPLRNERRRCDVFAENPRCVDIPRQTITY